jgi:hypothetical protein
MATPADEFDPPPEVLHTLVRTVLAPALSDLSAELAIPFVAKVEVWVREEAIPKCSLTVQGIGAYSIEENTLVRIRVRRTFRDDRILYSIETQHADVWRQSGFSGIRCHGDLLVNGPTMSARLKNKTICYHAGWNGW